MAKAKRPITKQECTEDCAAIRGKLEEALREIMALKAGAEATRKAIVALAKQLDGHYEFHREPPRY